MDFGKRIPLKQLARFCHSLSTMLNTGVEVDRALELAAGRAGGSRVRDFAAAAQVIVKSGSAFHVAIKRHHEQFTEVMRDMVVVGEESGHLPEVLKQLSEHFDTLHEMRTKFLRSIAWPVLQFVAGTLVVAGLIALLGMLGNTDMLGLGLMGPGDAMFFLAFIYGSIAMLFFAYMVASKNLSSKAKVHEFLMRIPVVGKCMTSFAIARFSWAFALTQQTGMTIDRSLELSLRASGNGVYQNLYEFLRRRIHEGDELGAALAATEKFPPDFVEMVRVGENAGTVPEELMRLQPQFQEDAQRALQTLAQIMGFAVWFVVAGMIIFIVFSVILTYVGMINNLTREIM
ncbi:MAG: type II secretion system F family protein [Planctomycetota bacterium]|nr:type II secretion system F family protein [Planctomycetota bacterium]